LIFRLFIIIYFEFWFLICVRVCVCHFF
jgi:hypothetical protein